MESIVMQRRRAAMGEGGALAALAELCDHNESGRDHWRQNTRVIPPLSLTLPSSSATVSASSSSSSSSLQPRPSCYISVMADLHHIPDATPAPVTPLGTVPQIHDITARDILSASLSLAGLSKSPVVFNNDQRRQQPKEESLGVLTRLPPVSESVSSSSSVSSACEKSASTDALSSVPIQPRTTLRTSSSAESQHPSHENTSPPMEAKNEESDATASTLANPTNNAERLRFREYQVSTWSQRLEEVQDFVRQHGHCMIPSDYPSNQKLAKWAKRQRCQYQLFQSNPSKSSMTLERIRVLEDLGFCWQNKMSVWQARYEELLLFHLEFGHTQVPSSYKPNQRLATWVKCQRRQKRLRDRGKPSSMTDDRIALLDSVNFIWRMYPSNPREE